MFTTIQKQVTTLASTRARLATHYELLALDPRCPPRVRLLLERIADEEKQLALGLRELAERDHVALRSWVQFPRRLPPVPSELPRTLQDVLALSKEVDEATASLWRPLKSSTNRALREWSETLNTCLAARGRNRSALLALES